MFWAPGIAFDLIGIDGQMGTGLLPEWIPLGEDNPATYGREFGAEPLYSAFQYY